MNGVERDDAASSPRFGLAGLLAETLCVQAMGTTAILVVPALAPLVAADLRLPSSAVGYQISLVYFAGMVSSAFSGALVMRLGPCRTGQTAMLLAAAGCALASLASVFTLILASLVWGLAYGLINPAAAELLMRHSPAARRNLIFSVKQTGVPLGGMVAGLIGPQVALLVNWQAAVLAVAVCCVLVAAVSQFGRARLDAHRSLGAVKLLSTGALRVVMATPGLRWLALSSFFFSAIQLCVVSFLVVMLVEDLRFSLVEAGALLAAVQVGGAVGRIVWGQAADMVGDGLLVLLALAGAMATAAAVLMLATPDWPVPLTGGLLLMLGLTAVGWNGVYLSEVARQAPRGAAGAVTGASMFITFTGVVIGPIVFSKLHALLGSYVESYGFLVVLAACGATMIAFNRWTGTREGPGEERGNL